jgi:hypothetical protein
MVTRTVTVHFHIFFCCLCWLSLPNLLLHLLLWQQYQQQTQRLLLRLQQTIAMQLATVSQPSHC